MWHVGIDLHRTTVVLAAVNDIGGAMNPITIPCPDSASIVEVVKALGPFRGDRSYGNLPLVVRSAAAVRNGSSGPSHATSAPSRDMVRDELLERFRHYAEQMTLFDKRLEEVRQVFPAGRSVARYPRHGPVFGAVDRRGNRRGRAFPHGQAGRRLFGPHVPCSSIRRPLLPRLDHASGLSLAAMGSGPGCHEGGSQGRCLEKLLQPHPQTIEREDCPGGGGPKTRGDMLETPAALAA